MLLSVPTAINADCLAQTGSDGTVAIVAVAVLALVFGFVMLRARAKGKRSLGALLLLGALAVGGLSTLVSGGMPAQAATSGEVCVEQTTPTPTPTPSQTPLTLVFLGQQALTTQVPLDLHAVQEGQVELQNGVIRGGALTDAMTVCEDAQTLSNCVTFEAGTIADTSKTLLLSGANKKLNFAGQGSNDVLLFDAAPVNPFDWNAKDDVVVPPTTVTGLTYSNASTIYFSLRTAAG